MQQPVGVTGANGYVSGLVLSALAPEFNVILLVRIPKAEAEHQRHFDMKEREMTGILQRDSVTTTVHVAWDIFICDSARGPRRFLCRAMRSDARASSCHLSYRLDAGHCGSKTV